MVVCLGSLVLRPLAPVLPARLPLFPNAPLNGFELYVLLRPSHRRYPGVAAAVAAAVAEVVFPSRSVSASASCCRKAAYKTIQTLQ